MKKYGKKETKGLRNVLRTLHRQGFRIKYFTIYQFEPSQDVQIEGQENGTGGMTPILALTSQREGADLTKFLNAKSKLTLPIDDVGLSLTRVGELHSENSYDLDVDTRKRQVRYGDNFKGCREGYEEIARTFREKGWRVRKGFDNKD